MSNKTQTPKTLQTKEANEAEKMLWQKPQLKKLQISLDTAFFSGSNADATRSTM